jgi:sulfide dehydrogenase [flavocytochrome c] flavoprotein chain
MSRRSFFKKITQLSLGIWAASPLVSTIWAASQPKYLKTAVQQKSKQTITKQRSHVVIIGAGFAGATAAKYIGKYAPDIAVSIIEPNEHFISCPMSNLVVANHWGLEKITFSYQQLIQKYQINWHATTVKEVIAQARGGYVICENGEKIYYDRLIIASGIELMSDKIKGLDQYGHLHAWKAGKQTQQLAEKIKNLKDGEDVIISIPAAPYRCPPGPYERASLIASYLKENKPNSKVIVLDANPDIVSKPAFFRKSWQTHLKQHLEYHANFQVTEVTDSQAQNELGESFKAGVLNIIPPMRANRLLHNLNLTKNGWAEIDFLTFESKMPHIHVIGDAVASAPKMPKSGHIANQQGKYCAKAVIALLKGYTPAASIYNNTCYSFIHPAIAGHVAAVYRYQLEAKSMIMVPESNGISKDATELEATYAYQWAKGIWLDVLS